MTKILFVTQPRFVIHIPQNSIPSHLITLKRGFIVMFLRNININEVLCKGTRYIFNEMTQRFLCLRVVTGKIRHRSSSFQQSLPNLEVTISPLQVFQAYSFWFAPFLVKLQRSQKYIHLYLKLGSIGLTNVTPMTSYLWNVHELMILEIA